MDVRASVGGAVAEGLDWTGFHRIEKDLWVPADDALNADGETPAWQDWAPSTDAERAAFGERDGVAQQQRARRQVIRFVQLGLGERRRAQVNVAAPLRAPRRLSRCVSSKRSPSKGPPSRRA